MCNLLGCSGVDGGSNVEVLEEFWIIESLVPGANVFSSGNTDPCEWVCNSSAKFLKYKDGVIVFCGVVDLQELIFGFGLPNFSGDVDDASERCAITNGDMEGIAEC